MLPYEMLEAAVYNNWHSYGLVTRVGDKLDIKKSVPKSGEVDPKAVWKLLEDDVEYERFLHLRHNTAGATNDENCHPFDIYYSPKTGRQVVFMHNGTLFGYKSKKITPDNREVDDDDGPSDTKNFVDRILIPYLSSIDFGNGHGDIEHPHIRELVRRFWSVNNRGLLISSDQKPFYLDDWKELDDGDGGKFLASNDTYFKNVTRGPEFSRRELRKKQMQGVIKAQKGSKTREVVSYSDFQKGNKHPFFDLSTSTAKVVNDWQMYDRTHATRLGFATVDELKELYAEEQDCLYVMDWVFTDYAKLYEEFGMMKEKHQKASAMIANLTEQARAKAS
jgi:hypothetical protein